MKEYLIKKLNTLNKLFYARIYLNSLRLKHYILYHLSFPEKKYDFVIIDDAVPKYLAGFRDYEFVGFLKNYKNMVLYSIIGSRISKKKQYDYFHIKTYKEYQSNRREFEEEYGIPASRLRPFFTWTKVNAKLAYVVFMSNAIFLVDYLEERNIKFVLELYPGGGFSILKEGVMYENLKRVLGSPCLEKVIATQPITYSFLLENNLCDKSKVTYIHGGYLSKEFMDLPPKTLKYPEDKPTVDICFAAAKYMPGGQNKGYDIFMDMAHLLLKKASNFQFHIVGGFDETDIPPDPALKDHFHFYGHLKTKEFTPFYKDKDIFICPVRPFLLGKGIFDGFPTGTACEAGLHGLCLLMSDPLGQNEVFSGKGDSFFLENDPVLFADKVMELVSNPDLLYQTGYNGTISLQKKYQHKYQFDSRFEIINHALSKL